MECKRAQVTSWRRRRIKSRLSAAAVKKEADAAEAGGGGICPSLAWKRRMDARSERSGVIVKVYLRLAANLQVTGGNGEQNPLLLLFLSRLLRHPHHVCPKSRGLISLDVYNPFSPQSKFDLLLTLANFSSHFAPDVDMCDCASKVEGNVTLRL